MSFWEEAYRKEEKQKSIFSVIGIITSLFVIGILLVYLIGQFAFKHSNQTGTYNYMNTGWTWHKSDGTTQEVEFPCNLHTARGEEVVLTSQVPGDVTDGMYMYILVGRNIKVFLDGECRFELKQSDMELPGKIVKGIYIPIRLYKEDAGKEIKFVKQEKGAVSGNFNEIMYGDLGAMNYRILKLYGPTFILAVLLFMISVAIIISGVLVKYRMHTDFQIKTMSYGVMLLSIWEICDSYAYQFVFRNYYVDGVVAYMIMCVATLPFIHYLNKVQERRYEKLLAIMSGIQIVIATLTYILHFTGICSFELTRPYVNTMIAIVCVVIIITLVIDKKQNYVGDYKYVIWGMIALAICGCAELIYINLFKEQTYGLFIIIGLYLLVGAAFVHSVNELNRIERERQDALNASLMKSTFLANMSHEIRTPINSIVGMNEMILRENEEPVIKEYAEYIDRSSRLLLGIISDILDFSRIEAGKIEVCTEKYELSTMIRDLTGLLDVHTSQKNLRSVVTISESLPAVLTGDRIHIQQVVINLISNAVKYTEEGSITFSLNARKEDDENCVLCFRISDTGIGIQKNDLDHIFDSFSRFDEKKNRNVQGTGLGMAITKNLVDVLGGNISIESEYGRGTSVMVEFPQKIETAEVIGNSWKQVPDKKAIRGYKEKFKAPEGRILAVDDNNTNLLIIKQYLKKTDINIDMCNNGKEALEKCAENVYDIILLDHMMPVMDGIETIEKIRENEANANSKDIIIALTANAIAGSREFYVEKGFDDYITKPLDAEEFEEAIMRYLPEEKVVRI
ncbi:MAG: response regulator [Lachnospiraceae bacterium]|nr:response regulator [Candidatus Colinaster scatohippi]